MREFGWCFLGAGNIAFKTCRELVASGGKVVSVWNRTTSKAKKFASTFDCTQYDEIIDAIKAPGVDGVYVNVIHPKHFDLAKICLENHVPVLCEKPLTCYANETIELFNLAEKYNTYFAEAMWTWYSPVALKVKDWIKEGKIGKVTHVKGAFAYPMLYFNKNPRLYKPELGGGALLDLGVYPVRYCYELFGNPKKVIANGKVKNGVDIDNYIIFEYEDFKAEIISSFTGFKGHYIKIKGELGEIYVPRFNGPHKAILKGKFKEKFVYNELLYGTEFRECEKEILTKNIHPQLVSKQGSIDTMKLMDECLSQMGVVYPRREK